MTGIGLGRTECECEGVQAEAGEREERETTKAGVIGKESEAVQVCACVWAETRSRQDGRRGGEALRPNHAAGRIASAEVRTREREREDGRDW